MAQTEFEQLKKALMELEKPSVYFEELRSSGDLETWYPELKALIGVPQNLKFHREGDAWVHTLMVVDEAAKRRHIAKNPLGLVLSALCHDFGKAVATNVVDGVAHAYGHEVKGLPLAAKFLGRLGVDDDLKAYVLNMVELHMQPNIIAGAGAKVKSSNRLFDLSVEPFDLIQLAICDGLGKIPMQSGNEAFLMERLACFQETMAQPYVSEIDFIDIGLCDAEMTQVLEYAHKLRLAGCDKGNSLIQCRSYARKNFKKS